MPDDENSDTEPTSGEGSDAPVATVDIDEAVPPEHYRAVAEVIGYVMRLRRRH